VFSTVIELPTSELAPKPEIHIWGRCSVRKGGKLLHVDRAGHPSVSSFFNTGDTKEEYNHAAFKTLTHLSESSPAAAACAADTSTELL